MITTKTKHGTFLSEVRINGILLLSESKDRGDSRDGCFALIGERIGKVVNLKTFKNRGLK